MLDTVTAMANAGVWCVGERGEGLMDVERQLARGSTFMPKVKHLHGFVLLQLTGPELRKSYDFSMSLKPLVTGTLYVI